jgi:hypothetical protein
MTRLAVERWRGLGFAVAILACAGVGRAFPLGAQTASVQVASRPETKETAYRITDGPCQITWTLVDTDLNRGVINHRAECPRPLGMQAELIATLLAKVLEDKNRAGKLHTLALGPLRDIPNLSARLASAAKESGGWDLDEGRPKSGLVNAFVAALLERQQFYGELNKVFERFNLQTRVSGVEQVSVTSAGTLPFYAEIATRGIKPQDKVPYTCIVWLSIRPRDTK